jgi:hypothetical protein
MDLSLTDLFILGLGLDLAGAVLIARGLLISPAAIARLNTWGGLESGSTVDRARNWVDALFGVVYLALGFACQAGAYFVELGGSAPTHGGRRPLWGAFILIVTLCLALLLWRVSKNRGLKRLLVAVAQNKPVTSESEIKIEGWTRETAQRLRELGEAADWDPEGPELGDGGQIAYAKRVFGISIPRALYDGSNDLPH